MSTSTLESVANQFVELYGRQGTVSGENVSHFLSAFKVNPSALSRYASSAGKCQSRDLTSGAWQRGGNATQLLLSLWLQLQTPDCYMSAFGDGHGHSHGNGSEHGHSHEHGDKPTAAATWGIGLASITLINLCAAAGVLLLPFIGNRFYKMMMNFMVALGIGTLVANALLLLIPEAYQLEFFYEQVNKKNSTLVDAFGIPDVLPVHGGAEANWSDFRSPLPWYISRSIVAVVGVYGFFLLERLLKELVKNRIRGSNTVAAVEAASSSSNATSIVEVKAPPQKHGHSHTANLNLDEARPVSKLSQVQPVAWMVIIGDAIHNFVDGLSIGAAFTNSTLNGISISVAVFTHELPHELGDFAILLAAGMSVKTALIFNLLSSCSCYLGFVIGALLGEVPGASVFIFALAAGMFLYIALVDMFPELSQMLEEEEENGGSRIKVFVAQNFGIILGFVIILLLAIYGEGISFGDDHGHSHDH